MLDYGWPALSMDWFTQNAYAPFSLPVLAVFFAVLALNLVGDVLRDALDPRLAL